ncbi:MFS transporter [Micromonospora coxensis]|uniref:Nitrate/nitrite transporter NarK n=1 Tax=Micromonospora coxensis TaxID=356852 RepID=A0A1C5HDU2_9ACTN|nr:MFS transporter [Micromonospora coxensis]SCG44150.1 Nitrate/nitrite transporter NarK [Micromonospora coxensis]
MSATWATLRSFPLPVRLLVVNQLGVNIGFYMLLPYLAGYLADEVGLSAALIGLVLGVRNLSQQGMFLIGGSAADRLGARGVIIAGCALRTVGFAVFALGVSLPALLVASVLSGLAGALFNPAVRAYLAQAAPDRRSEAFALFNVFASAGALLGPLVGSALLLVDFTAAAWGAAAVFAALTVAQALVLPPQPVVRSGQTLGRDWRECLTDRRFLVFTLALSAMFALQNQLYLVLPVQAGHATGSPVAVAALFVASTVVTLAGQIPLTRWLSGRTARGTAITVGMAVMGGAFLLPLLPAGTGPVGLLPVLGAAVLLAVGVMIAQPFVLELVPGFAREGLTGTYFGLFYLVSGVVAATATTAVGRAMGDADGAGVPAGAWLLCAALGLASAAAVRLLHRRHRLGPRPVPVDAEAPA